MLPQMSRVSTNMQAHLHWLPRAASIPTQHGNGCASLATPFYQLQFCRTGLWLPSQTDLMTEEGLKTWITEGASVRLLQDRDRVPAALGTVLYLPIGYPRATSVLYPALDAIWIGDKTAEER